MSSLTIAEITSTLTALITDTPTPAPTMALIADVTESSSSSTTTSRRGFGQGPGVYGGPGLKEIIPPGRQYNNPNYVPPAPWVLAIIFSIMGLIFLGSLWAWWDCNKTEKKKLKQGQLAMDVEVGGQTEIEQEAGRQKESDQEAANEKGSNQDASEPQKAKKADEVVHKESV
jgi:hypothetical protein